MSAATQPVGRRVSPQAAGDFLKNNPIYLAIALLVIVTSVVEPKFLTLNNFDNIVRQFGVLVFAALGMTFVIMAGFLDLSIGGIISLVAVVTVTLIDPSSGRVPRSWSASRSAWHAGCSTAS